MPAFVCLPELLPGSVPAGHQGPVRAVAVAARTADYIAAAEAVALAIVVLAGAAVGAADPAAAGCISVAAAAYEVSAVAAAALAAAGSIVVVAAAP